MAIYFITTAAATVEIDVDTVSSYFRHEPTIIRHYIRATAIRESLIMHLVMDATIDGMLLIRLCISRMQLNLLLHMHESIRCWRWSSPRFV